MTSNLRVEIRTPSETIYDGAVRSLRVPTHTGQVGLRPRGEPTVLAVSPGLIVLRTGSQEIYVGAAGGLLHTDQATAKLLTPMAVVGEDVDSVLEQLDHLLSTPSEEMELRNTLGRLESRILQEVQQEHEGDPS